MHQPPRRSNKHVLQAMTVALAVGQVGCTECEMVDVDPIPFVKDEPLTAEQVATIRAQLGLAQGQELTCEQACRERNDMVVAQCTVDLPGPTTAAEDVGHIQCSGEIVPFCEGRRELAHVPWRAGGDDLADHIASMAYMEAASVTAFEELAADLARFEAPKSLRRRCLAAARDERKHASTLTAIANKMGVQVPVPTAVRSIQPLLAVAKHNAVEGCVHEAWAALIARCRASTTVDIGLARVFAEIARDEARHAQLAWDVHVFLQAKLALVDPAGAALVDRLQREALANLPKLARAQSNQPRALRPFGADTAGRVAEVFARQLAA